MLYHYGRSGTTYLYIHLNNDLTARNDNKGGCVKDVAFAVPNGAKVTAGQQIAWNGDSGDANGNPHLHFEVHPNDGADVNPFKYLQARREAALRREDRAASSASALRGTLIAAGAGAATLAGRSRPPVPGRSLARRSTRARWSSPSRSAPRSRASLDQLAGPTLRTLKTPIRVAAFTLKANATPDAIVGAPGELLLGRVAPTP